MVIKNYMILVFGLISINGSKSLDDQDFYEIVRDPYNVVEYQCRNEILLINIDAISDLTNNLDRVENSIDYFRLYIDLDSDQIIDSYQDLLITTSDDGICVTYLINEYSTAECEESTTFQLESKFISTKNNRVPHINHKISIPIQVLSSNNTLGVYINIFNKNGTDFYYPKRNKNIFDSTLKINCSSA